MTPREWHRDLSQDPKVDQDVYVHISETHLAMELFHLLTSKKISLVLNTKQMETFAPVIDGIVYLKSCSLTGH